MLIRISTLSLMLVGSGCSPALETETGSDPREIAPAAATTSPSGQAAPSPIAVASLAPAPDASPTTPAPDWPQAPELEASGWLNSEPLEMAALRGKVVLIEFWTFG
jgi:hypothetical protein